jgi:hypothetical protein
MAAEQRWSVGTCRGLNRSRIHSIPVQLSPTPLHLADEACM